MKMEAPVTEHHLYTYLKKNIKAMFFGDHIPINLVITALLGFGCALAQSVLPFARFDAKKSLDNDRTLIIVFSIISWAEVIRSCVM